MSKANSPSSGFISMPCRPSTPPVNAVSLLAASYSISDTPSVTMSRVRSAPRSTRKLVTKPAAPASATAAARPSSGSPKPYLASDARRVGAEAEEGRVAERDDAGIAEDQVEREREQRR